jgi:hypothetical protein
MMGKPYSKLPKHILFLFYLTVVIELFLSLLVNLVSQPSAFLLSTSFLLGEKGIVRSYSIYARLRHLF